MKNVKQLKLYEEKKTKGTSKASKNEEHNTQIYHPFINKKSNEDC